MWRPCHLHDRHKRRATDENPFSGKRTELKVKLQYRDWRSFCRWWKGLSHFHLRQLWFGTGFTFVRTETFHRRTRTHSQSGDQRQEKILQSS